MRPVIPRIRAHVLSERQSEEVIRKRIVNVQPIPAGPPKGEEEEDGKNQGCHFAGIRIESASNEASTNEG